MFTVIETAVFARQASQVWTEAQHLAFIDWIAEHPEAGAVIPGAGGLRKVRWGRSGLGKQGGARVVYYAKTAQGEVWLLTVYAKSRLDDVPIVLLRQWKEALDGS